MRWIAFCIACLMSTPAMAANVYEFAEETPGYGRFASLMQQTGIDKALGNRGPYTIFAPDDAALTSLPQGLDREKLVQILTCHMTPSRVLTSTLSPGTEAVVRPVGGCRLWVRRTADGIVVRDDAGRQHRLTRTDIMQSNGVVHAVGSVIYPAY
ncbi:fasciclin domain-containing protein [Falsirhodobacter deserti]|uniref:fasciclin domain-containing protein n=1 Tax=Falsirhodobacter deserti TaxID=1365611 RepID=UPI0013E2F810|nr:fasciclin domain-containing protein [Falsirhodobacter deserti]